MTEQRIVVPLDGSPLSEGALPYANVLAKATGAGLLLVTVWEEGERALLARVPDRSADLLEQGERERREYLERHAQQVRASGVDAETDVLIGDAGDELLRLVERRDPHLLVMATHGRSGLTRWWYGSVAAKLAREAPLTTLLIGPEALERKQPPERIARILVPLDGSALAESALGPAVDLAGRLDAELVVAQVLRWPSQAFAFGVPEVNVEDIARELTAAAEQYLQRVIDGLRTKDPVSLRVLQGMPADALRDLVDREKIDLVVMTSHTRSGLGRALLGSVADRMLHSAAPVLLVRPEGAVTAVAPERGRYCHNCGRASPYQQVTSEDRCLRCGQHLHACGNCVYFDGVECLIGRPEVHDVYPGLNCPYFQFREREAPKVESST